MLGAMVTLLDALFKPGAQVRILGGSLEQSRKMYRYLLRMLVPRFAHLLLRPDEEDRLIGPRRAVGARHIRFANGSEVEILAQSERSVRGNRVQKMRCDEVELFSEEVWTSCQLVTEAMALPEGDDPPADGTDAEDAGRRLPGPRTGPQRLDEPAPRPRFVRGAVEAFSTMHRPHGLMQRLVERNGRSGSPVFHWCLLDVLERCDDSRHCADCPLAPDCGGRARRAAGHFRIDDAIAARARVSRETWESEMLCLRPSRQGAVFPAFARERHVASVAYRRDRPTFRAIDFGFVHPFVCLWLQTDAEGNVFVVGEYVRERATVQAHVDRLRELDPGPVKMTYCDPAGGQASQLTGSSYRAELGAAGIPTRARASSIVEGLELVRRFLEGDGRVRPTLRIDRSCVRLIAALEAYRYPGAGAAHPELPVKDGVHDHPIDALRYFFIHHAGAARRGRVVVRLY